MFIHSTSKKLAAFFSYLFIGLNSISSILLTPFLLKYLGVDEYGVYQMIYSIGQYVLILDLGIGTVMVRYLAEYLAKNDMQGLRGFAGMMSLMTLIICFIVIAVGIYIDLNIVNIFPNLPSEFIDKAHWMFNLMIIQFVFTIIDNYINGAIFAFERFVFTKIVGIIKILLVLGLTILLVYLGYGAVGVVLANTIVISMALIINIVYAYYVIGFRISIKGWDLKCLYPAMGLMLAMLLQSVVANVNSSVDKTILGIMCTPTDVAIYSIAATIITMFNTLPTVISGFFQPQVTRMVVVGTNGAELTDLVIRVGRWQFIICAAMLSGLTLFGADFLNLWVGGSFSADEIHFCLLIMLIILPFNMLPLIQNVCITILNAYDKRLHRSLILMGICVLHIFFTIIVVKGWGPIGSPLGTAISYFIGYVIVLNVYYSKVLGLEISRMFKEIFSRLWICIIFSTLLCCPFYLISVNSWGVFCIECIIFIVVLFASLLKYGFNGDERLIVQSSLNTILRRK